MGVCDHSNKRKQISNYNEKNSMNTSNINYRNNHKVSVVKNKCMLNNSSVSSSNISTNFYEQRWFPRGEQYYKIIKDSNYKDLFDLENKNNNWQSEKIELFFSLLNLFNPQYLYSLSVTIINNNRIGVESYLGDLDQGRGENIYFGNSFQIDYFYERKQKIIIKPIIENKRLNNYEYTFILSDLMGTQNKYLVQEVPKFGKLKINTLSLNNYNYGANLANVFSNFKFKINMFNISIMNTPNLFFVINHFKDGEKRRPVYKSSEFNTNEIKTNVIKIESDFLCNNINDKIFLEIYSYQQVPSLLATGIFTLSQLLSNSSRNALTEVSLYDINKQNIGLAKIQYYSTNKSSFVDKLSKNKMQINLEIAIDYTKSNGPPNDPRSNHYINGPSLNDYEIAIKSCCEILAPYDADQLFPVYGFGGIPSILNGRENNIVSHCFNINFQQNPEIHGIENILKAYRESLSMVKLAGNTKFSFFLNKVISNINKDLKYKRKENHYYILLILTDGVVNDLRETIDLIVEASSLPLSIVIVGIGNEDFSFMEKLDGDEIPLENSQNVKRKRDIVQFIQFNNFKRNNAINLGTDFVEEVLKEIPRQIDEYYNNIGKFY